MSMSSSIIRLIMFAQFHNMTSRAVSGNWDMHRAVVDCAGGLFGVRRIPIEMGAGRKNPHS